MAILKHSIKFNLQHNITKNKDTAIRCTVRFNNERIVFGTNLKVNPKFWNDKTQSVKSTTVYNSAEIQEKINSIRLHIKKLFESMAAYPEPDILKGLLQDYIAAKPKQEVVVNKPSLIDYMSNLIEKMKSGDKRIAGGRSLGQRYKDGTIRGYNTALVKIKGFAEYCNKDEFTFDEIDRGFYDGLQSYFYNELKVSTNYFATIIKILKSVMNNAKEDRLHKNTEFDSRYFLKPSYESDTVYLDVGQLKKIKDCELPESYLKQSRDLFLIGCWTGLRFSDFSTLRKSDIDGGFIKIQTEKTKERVAIPVHPVILEILDRYDGEFPKVITNQRLNLYIKVVAKRSNLSKIVSVKRNKGGVDVYEKVDFCDLVTTHTARRSFATNMFKMGIPTLVIMAITGHRTEAAFLRYIRVSNEEKANMMLDLWHKKGVFN